MASEKTKSKKEKHIGLQLPHETLESYRYRAIELRQQGWQVKEIAESFGLHPNSVSRWFVNYRRKGKKALQSRKGTGRKPKLAPEEIRQLCQFLKKDALEFGFETPLWNCNELRIVILKRFHKKLDNSNVWRWLIRLKKSNQKPQRRATEQDVVETERWILEEWPKILEHARKWRALLYFQDEAGVKMIPHLGKTWGDVGQTPIVRVTGNKRGLSLSSAMSMSGELLFRFETGNVNAVRYIDYLGKLRKHHPRRKMVVVADNAPVHTAGKVKQYVAENSDRFALYFFPKYSPEVNPDEHVWGYLKKHGLKWHEATKLEDFRRIVKNEMLGIQKKPELVKTFFYKTGLT